MKLNKKEQIEKMFTQIMEWQKDPEFIREAYEFIRTTTGKAS